MKRKRKKKIEMENGKRKMDKIKKIKVKKRMMEWRKESRCNEKGKWNGERKIEEKDDDMERGNREKGEKMIEWRNKNGGTG